MNYTPAQLADWKRYEKVRASGKYNMFDPRARDKTNLDRDEYLFVMKHYAELREAVEAQGESK
jgi:hypothetical protein